MSALPAFVLDTNNDSVTVGIEARIHSITVVTSHNCQLYNNDVSSNADLITTLKQIIVKHGKITKITVTGDKAEAIKILLLGEMNLESSFLSKEEAIETALAVVLKSKELTSEQLYYSSDDPLVHNFKKYQIDPNNPFIKGFMAKMMKLDAQCKLTDLSLENAVIKPKSLIVVCDEITEYFFYDANGMVTKLSGMPAGKNLILGMSKVLINKNNFDELCQLALHGDREKIDTQVYEILADDENSPYGKFPKDMPCFHFGKAMDHDIGVEDVEEADIVNSLTSLSMHEILTLAGSYMFSIGTTRLYLCGPTITKPIFLKHNLFRKSSSFSIGTLEILDMNYLLAMGAATSNQ